MPTSVVASVASRDIGIVIIINWDDIIAPPTVRVATRS